MPNELNRSLDSFDLLSMIAQWRVIASEAKQSHRKVRPEQIASPAFGGLAMTNIGPRSE